MEITRGKIERPQKVVIHGKEGIGKSTLASQFPNPIFTDIEGGTSHLDVTRTETPTSWEMIRRLTMEFQQDNHGFKTWVVDTADWAERLCKDYICGKHGIGTFGELGYGKDQQFLAEEFGKWLNALTVVCERGMNIVVLAHTHAKRVDLPEATGSYDCWEMKMERKTAGVLKEWADMVLFAAYEVFVNPDKKNMGKGKATGGRRVLRTTTHPAWEAKNRHNLDDVLDLDYSSIAECFASLTFPPREEEPEAETKVEETAAVLQDHIDNGTNPEPEPVEDTGRFEPESGPMRQLRDLMEQADVSIASLMATLYARGSFPEGTELKNVPDDYIQKLIANWSDVVQATKETGTV